MNMIINPYSVDHVWTPNNITTTAWWDASEKGGITESSNDASQLNDKGSTGTRHLVQGVGANQFKTNTRTFGGLNVLDSNGDIAFMRTTGSVIPTSGDVLIIAVCGVDSVDNIAGAMWGWEADGINRDFQYDADDATDFKGRLNSDNLGGVVAGDAAHNGPSIYANRFDFNGDNDLNSYVDGVANPNGPVTPYTNKINPAGEFFLFTNRVMARSPDGFFAEMVICEDVTTATRQRLEGYLAWKWDAGVAGTLVGKLDSGHPYKNSAP